MRKLLLLSAALMATASMSAQVLLWNGDDKELGSDGGFWNRAQPTVVEDDGNKCLKITLKENSGGWADEHRMAALPLAEADFKGLRRLTMRIKMAESHNVMIKLTKEGDGGYTGDETRRWFWYDAANGWQTMTYEYSIGPNSDKLTDTGNTLLEIWPYEFDNKWGEEIFIDDIRLDGPMVGDVAVRTLDDASLTDKQVIVAGSLSKGSYQNTWDGDWHVEAYDDYSLLLSKLSDNVCFLNLTGAVVADGDSPQLRQKNPNLLILSPVDFFDTDNVIRWDGEKNATPTMVINEAYPFYTPIDFQATNVELTRKCYAGYNTFVLPFWVSATDLGAAAVYTHKFGTTFKQDTDEYNPNGVAGGNVPFIADYAAESDEVMNFSEKGICTTPDNFDDSDFKGVYSPQSAENLWGINGDGKLQKGGSSATIKAFHAYLADIPANARAITFEQTTGVKQVERSEWKTKGFYNLNGQRVAQPTKGLYIVHSAALDQRSLAKEGTQEGRLQGKNGKKVMIK